MGDQDFTQPLSGRSLLGKGVLELLLVYQPALDEELAKRPPGEMGRFHCFLDRRRRANA